MSAFTPHVTAHEPRTRGQRASMRRCRVDEAFPTSSIKPRAPRQLLPRVLSRSHSPRSPGGQAPGQASRAALGTACGRQRRAAAAARSAAPGAPTSRDGLWAPPPRGRGSSPVFLSTCQACRGHRAAPARVGGDGGAQSRVQCVGGGDSAQPQTGQVGPTRPPGDALTRVACCRGLVPQQDVSGEPVGAAAGRASRLAP